LAFLRLYIAYFQGFRSLTKKSEVFCEKELDIMSNACIIASDTTASGWPRHRERPRGADGKSMRDQETLVSLV
jgi:hypothetical protein